MPRLDEDRLGRIEMISDLTNRIRDQVPSEEFDIETARSIAQKEVDKGTGYFEQRREDA